MLKNIILSRVTVAFAAVFSLAALYIPLQSYVSANSGFGRKFCKLEIVKSADKENAVPGETVVYTINFKNTGSGDCTGGGVHVVDELDEHLSFVTETHSSEVSSGYGDLPNFDTFVRTLHWNANVLNPGESGSVSITTKLASHDKFVCGDSKVPNKAKITAVELDDFNTWVSSNTVRVEVNRDCETPPPPSVVPPPAPNPPPPPPVPNLSIVKNAPATVMTGETYYYDVLVRNAGNTSLTNVIVTDLVPDVTAFVDASGAVCRLSPEPVPNGTVSCDLGILEAGAEKTIKLSFLAKTGTFCDYLIKNTAKASSDEAASATSAETSTRINCGGGGGGGASPPPTGGGGGGGTAYASMQLQKRVRNVSRGGEFADLVLANSGEILEYSILATNTGNQTASGLVFTDLQTDAGLLQSFRDLSVSTNYIGTLSASTESLKVAQLNSGQSLTITYRYTVASAASAEFKVCNTVKLTGDYFSLLKDTACVQGSQSGGGGFNGANVFLNFSKYAFNDTQNKDATAGFAMPEEFITYTLRVNNSGNSASTNFVMQDDLSGILALADVVDTGGGNLNGRTLVYPGVVVPAGSFVEREFRVRIKAFLPNISYIMRNTYGNTVDVRINQTQAAAPPRTGGWTQALGATSFGGFLAAGFVLWKRRRKMVE